MNVEHIYFLNIVISNLSIFFDHCRADTYAVPVS